MKKTWLWVIASAVALTAGAAAAQGGPGSGKGPGSGMQAAGPGASVPGMGPGQRMGRGPSARWGSDFTPGWSLMTPQERNEHQERMRSLKTYEECKTYRDQHREQMAARAKEKGGKALGQPRHDACASLKR